ncbi:GNAT family N-acetyltransferase [halophilic archaeon]|nr:GNAT family N-acetyltransferase [halophilic archaeon]
MQLREPSDDDAARIREVTESAMTTSYALSPQQIENIAETTFGEEPLSEAFDDDGTVLVVAEADAETSDEAGGGGEGTVIGVAVGEVEDGKGVLRWVLVDPEQRGRGAGAELFENGVERLRDRDVERVEATALEANTEGHQFFEEFGFVRVDERQIEVGGETLVEYVYSEEPNAEQSEAAESGDGGTAETGAEGEETTDFPNTETRDGELTATTEDGDRVYVAREETESGTEASFFVAYSEEAYEERYGYYCGNCGSLDTVVDDVGRIECGECGNVHATRSSEEYDDSYL